MEQKVQAVQKADSLPEGTILQGGSQNYEIRQEIGRSKYAVSYSASAAEETFAVLEFFPEETASRDSSLSERVVWKLNCSEEEIGERVQRALDLELNSIWEGESLNPGDVCDAFSANGTVYVVATMASGKKPDAIESAFAASVGAMEAAKNDRSEAAAAEEISENPEAEGVSEDTEVEGVSEDTEVEGAGAWTNSDGVQGSGTASTGNKNAAAGDTPAWDPSAGVAYSDSGETIRAGDFFFQRAGGIDTMNRTGGPVEPMLGETEGWQAADMENQPLESTPNEAAAGAAIPSGGNAGSGVTEPLNGGMYGGVTEALSYGAGAAGTTGGAGGSVGGGRTPSGSGNARTVGSGKKKRKSRKKGIIAAAAVVCVLAAAIITAVLVYRSNTIDSLAVTADPDTMSYYAGESFDPQGMELEVTYLSGKTTTISAGDDSEVTCEPETFSKAGETTVTIRYGKASTELTVTVSDVEISLAGSSMSMYTGDVKTMTVTTKPSGRKVTWSSSDETIATVSETGEITAVSIGEAEITASAVSGDKIVEASCTVTVNEPSISLDKSSITLYAGDTAVLTATVVPSGYGLDPAFTSSDSTVASVDSDGVVSALAEGTATITATILWQGTAYKATCSVTVETDLAAQAANTAFNAASTALEVRETAEEAKEAAWLAEDAASEAAEKAREAADTGDKLTYTSGGVYQGETNGTSRDGYGVHTASSGDTYEGQWVDDARVGYGIYTWTDGDYYTGQFSDGVRSGYGTYYYEDGRSYAGEWADDDNNGYGVLTFSDGGVYYGEFADGYRDGYGYETYSSGASYCGEYVDGYKEGYGVYIWADGSMHACEWVGGQPNGYGIRYSADGEIELAGYWEDGEYIGTEPN